MSESEQNETPQRTEDEWLELESELAEVRKKRDQLDAQNLRVTDNLRRTIEERDKAVEAAESLRSEYLKYKEAANTNSDNVAALREQVAEMDVDLRDMTRLRHHAKAQLEECCEDRARQVTALREQLARCKEAADMFEEENKSLQDTVRQLRAKQIHDDLPGILMVIQAAAQQARELI